MSNGLWLTIIDNFHWMAGLLSITSIVGITIVGKWLLFKIEPLSEMRKLNRRKDKEKWALEKYPPIVRATQKVGLYCNIIFYLLVLPFCVSLAPQPIWQILLNIIVLLMFYDFLYYLSHRFWFHGNGSMRQIHAIHHQARNPTYLDSHYVHPKETFIGLMLFMGSVVFLTVLMGTFHIATIVVTFIIFYQLNQVNHTFIDLSYFPYKTLSWITAKHHIHHENMHKGNYATITLFYDKLFGTLD
ncbi:MAG: sterol desaturase/sphingolipid hydroxylase (fatty acid hydroxylase superfamily) [Halioglobus sp.]|jgi:sterol desaturase/sphingolipid hydroxylase (fatty acid hydroxylase superfamily)